MTLVNWRGELDFGMTIEDVSGWMINEGELWRRWQGPGKDLPRCRNKRRRCCAHNTKGSFFLIAQNKNTVILSNKEVKQ